MTDLLTKTRKINTLLQQKNTFDMQADLPYDKMAVTLGGILDSNTYIIGSDGVLLGYNERHDVNNERIKTMFVEKQFPESYTDTVAQLMKTEANIPITSDITAFPVESREISIWSDDCRSDLWSWRTFGYDYLISYGTIVCR